MSKLEGRGSVVFIATAIDDSYRVVCAAHLSLLPAVEAVADVMRRNPERYAVAEADQVLTLALLAVANARDVLERICEETALDC